MDSMKYERLAEVNGRMRAEFFKSFLEAEGIDVQLFEESVNATSLVAPFAPVQIFVPREKVEAARTLLASYEEFQPQQTDDEDSA